MRKIRPYMVVTTLAIIYAGFIVFATGTPLALVTPGSKFSPDETYIYSETGYDGQFNYYIASDPIGAVSKIDVPEYRYQRILLPALGGLLAFGQINLIPFTLLLINLVVLAVSVAILEHFLSQYNMSRWYTLGYGLSMGVLGTVRLSLAEPLAYGLCIIGLWQLTRQHFYIGSIILVIAAFSKETTLIFSAAYGVQLLLDRKFGRATQYASIILVPFFIWQGVLWLWFGDPGIGSGGANATGFEIIPFWGVVRIIKDTPPDITLIAMLTLTMFVFPAVIWGFWRCIQDFRQGRWSLYSSLLLTNIGIMPFVPFSTYVEPFGILRFIVGLQIAVILHAAHQRRRRVLFYSTLWALSLMLILYPDVVLLLVDNG